MHPTYEKKGGCVLRDMGGRNAVKGCRDLVCPLRERSQFCRRDWREASVARKRPTRKEHCRKPEERWSMVGGLRKEGEPGSPQQQQMRGQEDPHGSASQDVKTVTVAKKETIFITG